MKECTCAEEQMEVFDRDILHKMKKDFGGKDWSQYENTVR